MEFDVKIMTDREILIEKLKAMLDASVNLWNNFIDIPKDMKHPQDEIELNRDVHDIQNRIFTTAYKNEISIDELK